MECLAHLALTPPPPPLPHAPNPEAAQATFWNRRVNPRVESIFKISKRRPTDGRSARHTEPHQSSTRAHRPHGGVPEESCLFVSANTACGGKTTSSKPTLVGHTKCLDKTCMRSINAGCKSMAQRKQTEWWLLRAAIQDIGGRPCVWYIEPGVENKRYPAASKYLVPSRHVAGHEK